MFSLLKRVRELPWDGQGLVRRGRPPKRWQKRAKHFERVDRLRVERGHPRLGPSRTPGRMIQNVRLWQGGDVSGARTLILQLLMRRRS